MVGGASDIGYGPAYEALLTGDDRMPGSRPAPTRHTGSRGLSASHSQGADVVDQGCDDDLVVGPRAIGSTATPVAGRGDLRDLSRILLVRGTLRVTPLS